MEFRGRWVLVTGASSGLGAAMARALALEHGANLVLTARRADRLETLARELSAVSCAVIPADLAVEGAAAELFREATRGREIHAAILNAGVTHFGPALELPEDRWRAMLRTNVLAPLELARAFHPYLVARGSGGGILLVASLAGLFATPWQAEYSGTKAFLVHWGQAFAHEVRGSGVSVTTFAPGGIATEMLTETGLRRVAQPGDLGIMPAGKCARLALEAMRKRRAFYVPGLLNNFTLLLSRLLPRSLFLKGTARIYEKGLTRSP
jgi:hypothetical protein